MRRSGEITVFLAMVLLSVSALLCTIVESARMAGARCFLRMAADSSMDSLMSQYHRSLWEKYRILGLEYEDKDHLEQELEEFMGPYLQAGNWYPMKPQKTETEQVIGLTQAEGKLFEQEILDYMRYGLIGVIWDELDEDGSGRLLENLQEAGSVERIAGSYSSHTKEAVKLENALEEIHQCLVSQEENWNQAAVALDDLDGAGFTCQAKGVIRDMKKLPRLVSAYEKRADALADSLKESRSHFEGETDLSQMVRAALEDEIRQYESYTDLDGKRRLQVMGLRDKSQENIAFAESAIEAAEAVMEYIADWDSENEEEELDEEELWEPVADFWAEYPMLKLGIEFGIKDKEKESVLEGVKDLAGDGILKLVLPEGAVVSGRRLELDSVPSIEGEKGDGHSETGNGKFSGLRAEAGVRNLVQRLMVCEYSVRYFKGFEKENAKEGMYELEYIIKGEKADKENLIGTINQLLVIRQGMNLVHVLSDTGKRQEARGLALAITGSIGLLPLVSIMTFFILSVWALGEALVDVRILMDGGTIPFVKTEADWKLGINELLELGRGKGLPENNREEGSGLDYTGYLRILCFWQYSREMVYRMMDVIQLAVSREQPGFLMRKCACIVDMKAAVGGKHVFFLPGLWKSGQDGGCHYETTIEVSGSYLSCEA